MESINILGIKKFMECILAQNIDFDYTDNLMTFTHQPYVDLNDYKQTLTQLEQRLDSLESNAEDYVNIRTSVELLRDLVIKLESKV